MSALGRARVPERALVMVQVTAQAPGMARARVPEKALEQAPVRA